MERTDQDFQDGLALDLFSPKNRTLVVRQNTKPLPGHFVTGTFGGPFIALSNYSYVIKMNESANDLIAKIEIPYDPAALALLGVQEGNTYVGRLADDKMSWVIDEATRNVHRSENNTRIIKMTSLDGEYMLLGRQAVDEANIFVQYGQGATRTVNITGGPGRQEAEFVDGLRFSVVAQASMAMNVDITHGIAPQSLPPGTASLNSFAWTVNTSNPNSMMNTTMRVPCKLSPPAIFLLLGLLMRRLLTAEAVNRLMLAALRPGGSSPTTMLAVARRPLHAPASTVYEMIDPANQEVLELTEDRIVVTNITKVDGQYVVLVTPPTNAPEL
ncbi:hypothetical protein NEMBOFW57_001202 [Staphylotrichum longicolle]|uniref:Uncharacterized protein n=1 Tax=Staphylotrichum longicolle TaxID=669026 RepID=A0AAD4F1D1_9PEZI|nr:hypothetical protein NEMBOFW57_001202 [Staphylotrichum longicolle]